MGFIILGLALFGKTVNDSTISSYEKIKDNFSLCYEDLFYVFNAYSLTTVDGVVKVSSGLKNPEELIAEIHQKSEKVNQKMGLYFEKTDCHKQKTLDQLKTNIEKSNAYWLKLIENLKKKERSYQFCIETLESGELYSVTDPILNDLSIIMNCHMERATKHVAESNKILENFKKVCITSCVIGLILVGIVIFDFIKDEIQKRSINNTSREGMGKPKRIVRRKKSP